MTFVQTYLDQAARICGLIDPNAVEAVVGELETVRRQRGRVFFLGVGGGAGHAGHAVNDFRKLAGLECYAPTDNVSELTARINDEGWETSFSAWLQGSHLSARDALFIFSVGGGSAERGISVNLVNAIDLAREVGASILGVVGRDGGYTLRYAKAAVVVPTVDPALVTPHTEAFQAVIWHLLVSHPRLAVQSTKWESLTNAAPLTRP